MTSRIWRPTGDQAASRLSFEQAVERACSTLGYDVAEKVCDKKERTLRDYGDPDIATRISIDDAFALDRAFNAAGGDGWPILESYIFRLGAEAAVPGYDAEALSRLTASAAIETGQALAALIAATRPGASPADLALARRETGQAMGALSHTLPVLDGAGPSPSMVTPRGGAPT